MKGLAKNRREKERKKEGRKYKQKRNRKEKKLEKSHCWEGCGVGLSNTHGSGLPTGKLACMHTCIHTYITVDTSALARPKNP